MSGFLELERRTATAEVVVAAICRATQSRRLDGGTCRARDLVPVDAAVAHPLTRDTGAMWATAGFVEAYAREWGRRRSRFTA